MPTLIKTKQKLIKVTEKLIKIRSSAIEFFFDYPPTQKLPHLTEWGKWGKFKRRCLVSLAFD